MKIFLREKIFRKICISKLSPLSNNILKKKKQNTTTKTKHVTCGHGQRQDCGLDELYIPGLVTLTRLHCLAK